MGLEVFVHVRRHALAIAAAELIPVPLVDTWVQNRLRRRLVLRAAAARGEKPSDEVIAVRADEAYAPVQRAALWPVKAVAKKVFWFVTPFVMWRSYEQAVVFGEGLFGESG